MSPEWIDKLAEEVKQKGQEAAQTYDREQHRAGIIAEQGKVFFTALILCLEEDFAQIRTRLRGSPVSCETTVHKDSPGHIRLTRSRFPWFDATLRHVPSSDDIVLEYDQGRGVSGEQILHNSTDRRSAHFSFLIDAHDKIFISESFEETQQQFAQPEDLARYIAELLFRV